MLAKSTNEEVNGDEAKTRWGFGQAYGSQDSKLGDDCSPMAMLPSYWPSAFEHRKDIQQDVKVMEKKKD